MFGVQISKIMEIVVLIAYFDRANLIGQLWKFETQHVSEKQYAECSSQGKNWRSLKLAGTPIVCGSEPVMGALENSTSTNHSSVGSSSDKCAFSNSGNSAENVTKKNVQEFSHVLSNPCESVISSESKMFEPQVTHHMSRWVFSN